ncbi:DUF4244 domain-containing protein [Cryobacterium sp. TMT1-2-1]|uniref:DUF4244 domain-containing protein n=1 Tax=Cryobacterium sp. TMT1-2-1 TaxID=1259232 RepID=UPI001F5424DA|nr:DUF4244 domain-containing protein [Cryobacterium sp. TMT1-2-1]
MQKELSPTAATATPTTVMPATATPTRRPRSPARALRRLREDAGAATAEYLVATMAAVGFAGLLIVILRGNEVRGILTELVRNALSVG